MDKHSIKTAFGKRLKDLRKRKGLTQQKLAELSELDYKHVQRLESKRPCSVKLETLEKLARAFGMTVSRLLDF